MILQCGSDSLDGGVVMLEIEIVIFIIIMSVGEVCVLLYQVFDKVWVGEMVESE